MPHIELEIAHVLFLAWNGHFENKLTMDGGVKAYLEYKLYNTWLVLLFKCRFFHCTRQADTVSSAFLATLRPSITSCRLVAK